VIVYRQVSIARYEIREGPGYVNAVDISVVKATTPKTLNAGCRRRGSCRHFVGPLPLIIVSLLACPSLLFCQIIKSTIDAMTGLKYQRVARDCS
jgi:hypothetical protein